MQNIPPGLLHWHKLHIFCIFLHIFGFRDIFANHFEYPVFIFGYFLQFFYKLCIFAFFIFHILHFAGLHFLHIFEFFCILCIMWCIFFACFLHIGHINCINLAKMHKFGMNSA